MDKLPSVRDVLRNTPVRERLDRCKAARHPMVFVWKKSSQLFSSSELFLKDVSEGWYTSIFLLEDSIKTLREQGNVWVITWMLQDSFIQRLKKKYFSLLCMSLSLISVDQLYCMWEKR